MDSAQDTVAKSLEGVGRDSGERLTHAVAQKTETTGEHLTCCPSLTHSSHFLKCWAAGDMLASAVEEDREEAAAPSTAESASESEEQLSPEPGSPTAPSDRDAGKLEDLQQPETAGAKDMEVEGEAASEMSPSGDVEPAGEEPEQSEEPAQESPAIAEVRSLS